jgi:hypothetical protein
MVDHGKIAAWVFRDHAGTQNEGWREIGEARRGVLDGSAGLQQLSCWLKPF